MNTIYHILCFVDDISAFLIFSQPIIATSVVIAIIIFLSLKKRMDTIITILKKTQTGVTNFAGTKN